MGEHEMRVRYRSHVKCRLACEYCCIESRVRSKTIASRYNEIETTNFVTSVGPRIF